MTKRIEAYSLFEFCKMIEVAIKEGYSFDFDSNENFPTAFGSYLTCGMNIVPKEVTEVVEVKEESTKSVRKASK